MRIERRRYYGLALAAALSVAACSGGSDAGGQTQPPNTPAQSVTTTLPPLEQPGSRCGAPDVKATVLRFPAADGTQLDGVLVGSGPAGVVLLHQYRADLCGFWPYAVYLSKHKLQALAIDLRCFGLSACPEDAKSRVVDDVAGAIAELQRHGAKRMSTGKFDLSTILGGSTPLDTESAAKRLTVPVMFAVARDDWGVAVEEVQALHRFAKSKDKQIEVLGGSYTGLHGWDLLGGSVGTAFTPFAAKVADFVVAHTRG
jgi:pimeloyl-ACP methyl ester carboxylesterase